jgi:hypothetical protein
MVASTTKGRIASRLYELVWREREVIAGCTIVLIVVMSDPISPQESQGGLLWFRLAFTLTVLLGCVIASTAWAETYYGQVLDEETGKPLEGASVTVIWYRAPLVYLDLVRRFQSAQETLTDTEGKFSLEAAPGIDWNPFTYVLKEPDVVIFKPGYASLANGFVRKTNTIIICQQWHLNTEL